MRLSGELLRGGCLCLGLMLLVGCGDFNVNKIFGSEDDAADTLFIEAQMAYDQGKFDEAETIVNKLLARNDRNEAAAILLGYINLSRGGIDPYRLASGLISLSEKKKSDATTSAAFTGHLDGSGSKNIEESTSSSGNSTETLRELTTLINLSEADYELLVESEASDGVFADNPVKIPAEVTDELRSGVSTLRYMNQAIKAICRFVDDGVKLDDDTRDTSAECVKVESANKNAAKAHFLWAFTHLTEALVYQSVLLYANPGSTKSNFETAADNLKLENYSGATAFTQFVDQVTAVNDVVNSVFDTDNPNSMIATTLRDMESVNLAFGKLAGLPESVTKKITDAMNKVTEVGQQVPGTDGEAVGEVGALKGQMTEKMSKTLGDKINKAIASKTGSASTKVEDIDDIEGLDQASKNQLKTDIPKVCDAYDNLTLGMSAEAKAASEPEACK